MINKDQIVERLYKKQRENLENVLDEEESKTRSETWFRNDTVNYWRHKRMYDSLLPIINQFPKSSWLTVGDGRYGTDAHYLLEKGLTVHASDIQDRLLKIGNKRAFIKEFSRQNAESLSFEDNKFDFVYCKEAYHHFPRPYIAVYEMLRVAKKGIILQEPKDSKIERTCIQRVFYFFLKILTQRKDHSFEESGNYVYTLSPREMEKLALGIGYRFIAYKIQGDHYMKGVETEKLNSKSKMFRKVKFRILMLEFLQKIGLINGGVLTILILKDMPDDNFKNILKKEGYKVMDLPKNPYE